MNILYFPDIVNHNVKNMLPKNWWKQKKELLTEKKMLGEIERIKEDKIKKNDSIKILKWKKIINLY